MTANLKALVQKMELRFTSGNSVPVERTHITASEWQLVRDEIERMESERQDGARIAETPKTGALKAQDKQANMIACETVFDLLMATGRESAAVEVRKLLHEIVGM